MYLRLFRLNDGIDGIIMEDKLGFSLIYMQAKKWAPDRAVGQPEIQSFVGAIAGKHGDGLFRYDSQILTEGEGLCKYPSYYSDRWRETCESDDRT